ncbi:MAG: BBP7 family outer membrane beta-barrel protein [Planctomycetaceae bacterium]
MGSPGLQPAPVQNSLGTPWINSTYGGPSGYPAAGGGYYAPEGPVVDDGMVIEHTGLDYDDGELAETPIEVAIKRALSSTWVRFDYLHWHIQNPGDTLVGASTTDIGDGYLTQYYPLNGNRFFPDEYFRDFDLGPIGLRDISGVQTTIGLPTTVGTFELSGFILQQGSDEVIARDLPGTGSSSIFDSFIGEFQFGDSAPLSNGITTTINGQTVPVQDAAFLRYNTAFKNRYTSDVWGAEFNWVRDGLEPGEGFKFRPLLGFRYLAIQEQMRIEGTDIRTVSGDTVIIQDKVSVENFNNIYGPQVGFRTELVHRWFTIGAEPKLMVGANNFLGSMRTSDLYGDGPVNRKDRTSEWSVVGDLDAYAKIPLNDIFSLYVSYNLTVASDVARPGDNARYDVLIDDSDNATNNFHIEDDTKAFRLEGYTVGIEIIFP